MTTPAEKPTFANPWNPLQYLRISLRGLGQVMFQGSELTGLFFLVGLLVSSPLTAAGAVIGALLGPAVALLAKFDRQEIEDGIHGFNPTLVGLASLFYLKPEPLTWALLIAGSIASVFATYAMRRFIKFPTYTMPFIVVTWLVLIVAHGMAGTTIDVVAAAPEHTPVGFFKEVLDGAAEVMFGANIFTGLLFLVGIAVSNRRHAALCLLGSILGTAVAIYHGDQAGTISLGIYGYNAALAAMGIYLWRPSFPIAILAAFLSVPFTEFFPQSLGIPALTAPFVVACWLVILVGWIESRFAPNA